MPAHTTKSKPSVLVALRERASFLDQYLPLEPCGGLLVHGRTRHEAGDAVVLELNFLSEQRAFRIRGGVEWVGDARGGMAAMRVAFPETERRTRDLLLEFAHGKELAFTQRSDLRFPVALRISYKSDAAFISDWTDDISHGGAFITTDREMDVGTILPLRLKVPGALLPLRLRGVVVWARKGPPAGVGVKFLFESERQRHKVEDLVTRLKADIIAHMQGRD